MLNGFFKNTLSKLLNNNQNLEIKNNFSLIKLDIILQIKNY